MNQSQNNFTFIDLLNIIIIFLQLKTELKLDRQASNNDLLKELNRDMDKIMERLDRIEKGNKND